MHSAEKLRTFGVSEISTMPNYSHRTAVSEAAKAAKLERHSTNPFMAEVKTTRTYKRKAVKDGVFTNEAGQTLDLSYNEAKYNDAEPFVKIYKRGSQALKFIGVAGCKVLEFVFERLQVNQGVVWLSQSEYVAALKNTPNSYYVGLNELIAAQFLAPTSEKGFYFINPSFFFNGSRLNVQHDFLKPTIPKKTE